MTAQLLSADLAALIQDSKRKNPDVRVVCIHRLGALELSRNPLAGRRQVTERAESPPSYIRGATGCRQVYYRGRQTAPKTDPARDLRRRPNFVRPFLLSCASKIPKLASTSVSSFQRLIVSGALAKETLKDVLDVLRDCTSLAQDIQLKILQVLPPLLQNYASHLAGDLLATALHICFLLFASKTAVVTNTAAATLQQLAVSAFGKAAHEDEASADHDVVAEVPVEDGTISVRSAALDAYRLLNDICLLTEGHSPTFLYPASMPQNFGLEIIEAILSNYAEIISSHPELTHVIRIRLMPFIIRVLSERVMFSTTVRSVRLLPLIFGNLLSVLSSECEMVLSLLNHMLDPDASVLWKRVLCMEVFRGLHSEATLVRSIYSLFDEQEGKRNIIQDHLGLLVRLASEKPAVIGLGQQSTVPASSGQTEDELDDMAALQADGVAGTFGVAMTLRASTAPGISARLSTLRVPCLDQLDKNEPPPIPPAYLYTLVLTCLNSFSEGLTRFLLPFTVPTDSRPKRKQKQITESGGLGTPSEEQDGDGDHEQRPPLDRALSNAVPAKAPVNPLTLTDHVLFDQIETSAHMTEACWPALLAAYSTFFHAALDSEYFHALVRSFQKFTQISGLLRLSTPRDAFLTTLGKSAVPSGLITATSAPPEPHSPDARDLRRGGPAMDKGAAATPVSASMDRNKRSLDIVRASLNSRNLLCLRALLHLGIALGPVLESAWSIVLETLQAADVIIHHITSQKRPSRSGHSSGKNDTDILGDIGNEIAAVRVAASRMFESSSDLPDAALLDVIRSLCGLLRLRGESPSSIDGGINSTPTAKTHTAKTSVSKPPAQTTDPRANVFVVESLDQAVEANSERLLAQPPRESGWQMIVDHMIRIVSLKTADRNLRVRSSHLTCVLVDLTASTSTEPSLKPVTRKAGLQALENLISTLDLHVFEDKASRTCESEIQNEALETLRSALERYGDSLAEGWRSVFAIISSVFVDTIDFEPGGQEIEKPVAARSPKLVRSSFDCLQLVCSDFLAAVPASCLRIMFYTTYQFCRQQEEFNIALTSTTFFGNISDQALSRPLTTIDEEDEGPQALSDQVHGNELLHLLLLLVNVSADERAEIRQSAIHSLFSVLQDWSTRMPSQQWMLVQSRVVLRLLSLNVNHRRKSLAGSELQETRASSGLDDAAVLMLDKTAELLTSHARVMITEKSFGPFWSELVIQCRDFLGRKDLRVSGAVYAALQHVLSHVGGEIGQLDMASIVLVWDLWLEANPVDHQQTSQAASGQEKTLLAYLRCLAALYPLFVDQIGPERLHTMLEELERCASRSIVSTAREDLGRMTPVQREVVNCIGMVDPTADGVASELMGSVSFLLDLPEGQPPGARQVISPTYVALSVTAMDNLVDLVQRCKRTRDIYDDGSFVAALNALKRAISRKHHAGVDSKSRPRWMKATDTLVAILRESLPCVVEMRVKDTTVAALWEAALDCIQSVISVDPGNRDAVEDFSNDDDFDIKSFEALHALTVPALGGEAVQDRLRRYFAASIFKHSLIHEPHPDDMPKSDSRLLEDLGSAHIGRVRKLPPSRRSQMCYVLFNKLADLTARHDGSDERVRLAQAAAPFLILRVSLVLKAYVVDQPLRGRMPLPASQRKELLHTLNMLAQLECEPRAMPGNAARSASSKMHLRWVYGLTVKALSVARHDPGLHSALSRVLNVASADSMN